MSWLMRRVIRKFRALGEQTAGGGGACRGRAPGVVARNGRAPADAGHWQESLMVWTHIDVVGEPTKGRTRLHRTQVSAARPGGLPGESGSSARKASGCRICWARYCQFDWPGPTEAASAGAMFDRLTLPRAFICRSKERPAGRVERLTTPVVPAVPAGEDRLSGLAQKPPQPTDISLSPTSSEGGLGTGDQQVV